MTHTHKQNIQDTLSWEAHGLRASSPEQEIVCVPLQSSPQEVEVRRSGFQDHSQLQSKFKAGVGHMRPCFNSAKGTVHYPLHANFLFSALFLLATLLSLNLLPGWFLEGRSSGLCLFCCCFAFGVCRHFLVLEIKPRTLNVIGSLPPNYIPSLHVLKQELT